MMNINLSKIKESQQIKIDIKEHMIKYISDYVDNNIQKIKNEMLNAAMDSITTKIKFDYDVNKRKDMIVVSMDGHI